MHPNTFIEQLWQGAESDRVFVAMQFGEDFDVRYNHVLRPAIEAVQYRGKPLVPTRVDESRTGDSILTEIIRGVCEARLVLVDVSDISNDPSASSTPIRNGNVMYELGLAHAVKSPAKVLIVRDDSKKLLFDVSSIPHHIVNFTDTAKAKAEITKLLVDRLQESEAIDDIKLRAVIDTVSEAEVAVLLQLFKASSSPGVDLTIDSSGKRIMPLNTSAAVRSLVGHGLVRSHLKLNPFKTLYSLTDRGTRAFHKILSVLRDDKDEI